MSQATSSSVQALREHGFALLQRQQLQAAEAHFAEASSQLPRDPALAFGLAQARFELGLPASDQFARAARLDGDRPELIRNQALALQAEGAGEAAHQLLEARLARHPDWLDGHRVLATLRWTAGDQAHFCDHLAAACRIRPQDQALWLLWFRSLAQIHDWPAARAVLDEAERHLGQIPALLVSRLFVAVESGAPDAQAWIEATAQFRGDVSSLCRIRHALRSGDPRRAEAEALPLVEGPSGPLYWPYLSLAWRLLVDARAEWLDRPQDLIRPLESGLGQTELEPLAELLRGLHTQAQPYIEQSVRGGTQTDRSVLLRHEPELQAIKARLLALLRDYIDALPPHDPDHPLLSSPRSGDLLIEGSWSVRLERQGYNVPHTHPLGWLSTAFYVSLPPSDQLGPEPAGHIAFGTPPAELGLGLEPYCTIKPRPGRLAVFPSTMWHGTIPFEQGERLVIAFDIRRPGQA